MTAENGVVKWSLIGTVAERTSSRLRRTNDRSVLRVHEDHEDDENAEIGVRQQCLINLINNIKYRQIHRDDYSTYYRTDNDYENRLHKSC
jgi:hypothetical protein